VSGHNAYAGIVFAWRYDTIIRAYACLQPLVATLTGCLRFPEGSQRSGSYPSLTYVLPFDGTGRKAGSGERGHENCETHGGSTNLVLEGRKRPRGAVFQARHPLSLPCACTLYGNDLVSELPTEINSLPALAQGSHRRIIAAGVSRSHCVKSGLNACADEARDFGRIRFLSTSFSRPYEANLPSPPPFRIMIEPH
jgi:hypothetical protein